ncbi:MAG: hypothetical protein WCG50_04130 [Rhodoferax sp.]|uniref:hypothetical protein n=1 Tax=Rhodoferax sp. TaxID=50421 RepID=UPI003015FBF3
MNDTHALNVWRKFCSRFAIEERCVPLFGIDREGAVRQRVIGKDRTSRPVLERSLETEKLILNETEKLLEDWRSGAHRYDGLIYCIGWKQSKHFIPLYIGKTETIGKGDGNLSANLKNLKSDKSKFARWGDNYAYHIGDLSACTLPGHAEAKRTEKYSAWAATLFEDAPSIAPRLRQPVYFWATAWNHSHVGIWEELGPTSLAFLEYLLIGVAGRVSPDLLNREGVGRRVRLPLSCPG